MIFKSWRINRLYVRLLWIITAIIQLYFNF